MFKRRNLLEEFGLGIDTELIEAGGGNLEMKGPAARCLALDQQRRALETRNHRRRQVRLDCLSRDTDGQVRPQMRNEILPHSFGGAALKGVPKRRECYARG